MDIPLNVTQIYAKIKNFWRLFPDAHFSKRLDHSRLVTTENEKTAKWLRLVGLSKMCMYVKREIGCSNIVVSQLNRNIELLKEQERNMNPWRLTSWSRFLALRWWFWCLRSETYRIERYLTGILKTYCSACLKKQRRWNRNYTFKHDLSINKVEEI